MTVEILLSISLVLSTLQLLYLIGIHKSVFTPRISGILKKKTAVKWTIWRELAQRAVNKILRRK